MLPAADVLHLSCSFLALALAHFCNKRLSVRVCLFLSLTFSCFSLFSFLLVGASVVENVVDIASNVGHILKEKRRRPTQHSSTIDVRRTVHACEPHVAHHRCVLAFGKEKKHKERGGKSTGG